MNYNSTMDLTRRYNQIKSIHQQRSWTTHPLFQVALQELSQIFLRHKANVDFAIALLHRHHRLRPGYAMIHSRGPEDEDYCNMEELGPREAFPCTYHCCLDGRVRFLPYEFSSTPVPAPNIDFLSEVAAYLQQHNLCDAIAVSYMAEPDRVRLEGLSQDGQGTIAVVTDKEQLLDKECIVTEWAVAQDDVGVKTVAIRACKEKESGHVRVD